MKKNRQNRPPLADLLLALAKRWQQPRQKSAPKTDNPLRRVGREMAALEAKNRKPMDVFTRQTDDSRKQLATRSARAKRDAAKKQTPKLSHAAFWRSYDAAAARMRGGR